jgi:hypothetical protein
MLSPLRNPGIKRIADGHPLGRTSGVDHNPSVSWKDFDGCGPGHATERARDFALAKASAAARLTLVGHDAFPTDCAQMLLFWGRALHHFGSFCKFCDHSQVFDLIEENHTT